ncbi:hypothetical protein Z052_00860 [Halorubrum sp. C191]|nr:hypothetical protein Z052_00860 [Halorubrum sp. C191]
MDIYGMVILRSKHFKQAGTELPGCKVSFPNRGESRKLFSALSLWKQRIEVGCDERLVQRIQGRELFSDSKPNRTSRIRSKIHEAVPEILMILAVFFSMKDSKKV